MPIDPQRSLEAIKAFLGALNTGAILIDRSGTIVQANQRFAEMMKKPVEDLVGSHTYDHYPDPADQKFLHSVLEHFEEKSEAEFHLPQPDGSKLPIIKSARPLPGPAPLNDYRLINVIDISKQKEAEASFKSQYEVIAQMSDTVLEQALELKHYSHTLEERVAERTADLLRAHMETIYMLAVASEAKDRDTGQHVRRVEHYSRELARRAGFTESQSEQIGYSSILHDVGKIHIPDEILTKPGPLDPDERAKMQTHTLAGEHILTGSTFFDLSRQIARGHHENWDGSGYPDKLAGEQIPVESRIVHLADVYDALTHARVYKKAWTRDDAIRAIHEGSGGMFDPGIVHAFDEAVKSEDFLAV